MTDATDQSPAADRPDEVAPAAPDDEAPPSPASDLAAIERDLDGVERALQRLDDGSYWNDEVTGEPIPDDVLATDPVARRAP